MTLEFITIGIVGLTVVELHLTFAYSDTGNIAIIFRKSLMEIPAGKYTVEIDMVKEQGNNWVVRLVKKILFFKKILSSDWFLEEQQAHTFAKKLAEQMKSGSDSSEIKNRKPGWVLRVPPKISVAPAIPST